MPVQLGGVFFLFQYHTNHCVKKLLKGVKMIP